MNAPRSLRVLHGTERSCGTCVECCTAAGVDETAKPAGVRCPALRLGKPGCGVHGTPQQPESCVSFRCLWLQGVGANDQRPDRVGVFLTLQQVEGVTASKAPGAPSFVRNNLTENRAIIAVECWRTAARTSAKGMLDEIRKVAPVGVVTFPEKATP